MDILDMINKVALKRTWKTPSEVKQLYLAMRIGFVKSMIKYHNFDPQELIVLLDKIKSLNTIIKYEVENNIRHRG